MMYIGPKIIVIICVISCFLLVSQVSAAGNYTAYREVTAQGPTGLLLPLGFENFMPLTNALVLYNWISIMMIGLLASQASQRNSRFWIILMVCFTGLVAFFGWLNSPISPTNNAEMWGRIIATAFVGVIIYLKDTNSEKHGVGGPGITIINVCWFIIFIQVALGIMNGSGLFVNHMAETPTQWQNVDLSSTIPGVSNTGGLLGSVISTGAQLITIGIMAIVTLIGILATLVCFEAVMLATFPFLGGSALSLAILTGIQIGIYISYVVFFTQLMYKPVPDPGWI